MVTGLTVHSKRSVCHQGGDLIFENALVLAKVFLVQVGDGNVAVADEGSLFGKLRRAQL